MTNAHVTGASAPPRGVHATTVLRTLALAAVLGLLATPSAARTYRNPIIDFDFPDPGVLYDQGTLWMTHTTGGVPGWPLLRSPDLVTNWVFDGNALTAANKPAWVQDLLWAPEIHRVQGRKPILGLYEEDTFSYVIVGTARSAVTGLLCIALATAPAVDGPYTVQTAPIVSDSVHVLDPDIFQDYDGRKYLLWKRDGSSAGPVGGTLQIRELTADATQFAPGSHASVLLTGLSAGWEHGVIEGPWMLRRLEKNRAYYYLFFSGGDCCTPGDDNDYALGVARSTSPTSGFTRFSKNPILRRNATWVSPGHGAIVRDARGKDWHYYHAYHANDFGKGRVQLLDVITYKSNGWPSFANGGTPSTGTRTAPVFANDAPPRVSIAAPAANATIGGNAALSAATFDDGEVKEVAFYRWGAYASKTRLGTARPTIYGWIVNWDTTSLPNGPYDIYARATDGYGHFGYSETMRVNIRN